MSFVVQKLCFTRGYQQILSNIELMLAPGESLLLQGANGAGKTTLLRCLAGLLSFEGEATLNTSSLTLDKNSYQEHIWYVPYRPMLKQQFTVSEALRYASPLFAEHSSEQLKNALITFGIEKLADRAVHSLSSGQQRKVCLSQLLLSRAQLWLLDEPLTALDCESQATLCQVLLEHQTRGGMIVLSSHQALPELTPTQVLRLGQ